MPLMILSCSKDDDISTATVEVTISYFYNTSQGFRPDTNAKLYLYKHTGATYERRWSDFMTGGLVVEGNGQRVMPDFTGTADVNGLVKINNVPYGKYVMVAAGKGRATYSLKTITLNAELYTDSKNFTHLHEQEQNGESW